jgi:replicative DNA helicase
MFGKQFLSAVLAVGKASALLEHGPIDHLFKASEEDVYKFVKGYTKEYGELPYHDTILAHTGETLVEHKGPPAYYYDLMVERHIETSLKKAGKAMIEKLGDKDPSAALTIMRDAVVGLLSHKNGKDMLDFREAYPLLWGDYVSKWNGQDDTGLRLGWPYLDEMSGGLRPGDLISIVGRPAQGKTFQMLYAALHGWNNPPEGQEGQSRLFVSMEMGVLPIMQRLAAMQTHLPMTQVKNAALSTNNLAKYKEGLLALESKDAPFYVLDGNLAATVDDIEALAQQLKPTAIFVDGAYLLQNPKERDRFKRIAENCDGLKNRLAKIAPTVASFQFNRDAAAKQKKKKGDNKPGLEDIFGSDAIGQHSSLVLGLFEEESVATVKQRRIEILKGRHGETGSFVTNWDFDKMDFSEVTEVALDELQIS